MDLIPIHIKDHVDRIIRELEKLHQKGHNISLQIFEDNNYYSGLKTTEYYLQAARDFRALLDTQNSSIFTGTEIEVRRKIYQKICEFHKVLSPDAILRVTKTTECQGQLERALQLAKKNPSTVSDARQISWFISNGSTINWCDLDSSANHKIFKLVQSEESFQKLLQHKKYPAVEITQLGTISCNNFRIALQFNDIETCYRSQHRIREYRNFWNNSHDVENFDTNYKIFNMWNDITETCIFFVYIPQL
ncbi:MAG: hypothetical protein IKL55_00215 [Clostridia bacterium]|nr:hypothetical protein [Clostridia bacterium]